MLAPDMGMELGMAVSVQELMEGGNAVKAGVKLGDEICQVSMGISYHGIDNHVTGNHGNIVGIVVRFS